MGAEMHETEEYKRWLQRCSNLSTDNKAFWNEIINKHESLFFEYAEDENDIDIE